MTLSSLRRCLAILETHGVRYVHAEHDIIYLCDDADVEKMSADEQVEMEALGAFIDSDSGGYAVFT